jgi:hypothetical protein
MQLVHIGFQRQALETTQMTTYDAAFTQVVDLNTRIRANVCPKVITDADVPAYVAWQEAARALTAEGRAAGFIRIFDGSFKLNLAKFAEVA